MDYYKVLGVSKDASSEDIKSAYRKKAHQYHPDTNPGDKKAEDMFKQINEANSVLSDPKKKRMYDMGADPNQNSRGGFGGFNPGGDPFADLFSQFSNGFGREHRQEGRVNIKPVNIFVKLNLYEGIFGVEKNIKFNYNETCNKCKGSGVEEWENCVVCGGSGMQTVQHGQNSHVMMPCRACKGRGKVSKVRCNACSGGGILGTKTREVTVSLRPGVLSGDSVVVQNGGIPGPDGSFGNLVVRIEIVLPSDSSFSSEDKDILKNLLNK